MPKRYKCNDLTVSIVCRFDSETFQEIWKRAEKNKQSIAASVRDLVEFGLMDEAGEIRL